MAPITLEGAVAGAVAVKFSTRRAEELAARIRFWALTLAAASLVLMGVLMSVAIHFVVDRPIRRFMDAISPAADRRRARHRLGRDGGRVRRARQPLQRDGRAHRPFSDELRTRIAEATGELDRRYQQVEQLNALLFEMQRRLSHAERLALSGQVMAEVAHEVGTPLHSVAGHLELLRKDLPPAVLPPVTSSGVSRSSRPSWRASSRSSAGSSDAPGAQPGEPTPVDLDAPRPRHRRAGSPGLASGRLTLEVRAEPALPAVRGQPTSSNR